MGKQSRCDLCSQRTKKDKFSKQRPGSRCPHCHLWACFDCIEKGDILGTVCSQLNQKNGCRPTVGCSFCTLGGCCEHTESCNTPQHRTAAQRNRMRCRTCRTLGCRICSLWINRRCLSCPEPERRRQPERSCKRKR